MELDIQIKKGDAITKAMNVSSVDADLLDGVVRLVRLVETPAERTKTDFRQLSENTTSGA
jgi:hypothetical protein